MSHGKERKEKVCLNCGAAIYGRYCHICGQENIEVKESFGSLITHFVYDITHFDSKFFSTIKFLLFKPGFLSKEYLQGRRNSYLHPIKMYVFTSAFFFLIFFSFYQKHDKKETNKKPLAERLKVNQKSLKEILAMSDEGFAAFTAKINKERGKDSIPMTREEFNQYFEEQVYHFNSVGWFNETYNSRKEYDSLIAVGKVQHNFLVKTFIRKIFDINERYKDNESALKTNLKEVFIHKIPQMLFVSLPFFALLLWLVNIRHRGDIYYVQHAIFTIHFYCAIFLVTLFGLWLTSIAHWFNLHVGNLIQIFFSLAGIFYFYKALRNFYGQARWKTITKFILLFFSFNILLGLLFVVFLIFSVFSL